LVESHDVDPSGTETDSDLDIGSNLGSILTVVLHKVAVFTPISLFRP